MSGEILVLFRHHLVNVRVLMDGKRTKKNRVDKVGLARDSVGFKCRHGKLPFVLPFLMKPLLHIAPSVSSTFLSNFGKFQIFAQRSQNITRRVNGAMTIPPLPDFGVVIHKNRVLKACGFAFSSPIFD